MPNIVYGLDRQGFVLWNDVIRFCQVTNQPQTPQIYRNIYHEVLSQIVSKIDADFQTYMQNLMTLPEWKTIDYTGEPLDYEATEFFRNTVRATGILLWETMTRKTGIDPTHFYLLEGSDTTFILIKDCVNANYV